MPPVNTKQMVALTSEQIDALKAALNHPINFHAMWKYMNSQWTMRLFEEKSHFLQWVLSRDQKLLTDIYIALVMSEQWIPATILHPTIEADYQETFELVHVHVMATVL